MPIVRNSAQKRETIEGFYQEIADHSSAIDNQIGTSLLAFIDMINQTFITTMRYGLTSHYRLVIQATDNGEDAWYIMVCADGIGKFHFEYQMPENTGPWKRASIRGEANSIEEAKDYLIIAMKESEGWEENKHRSVW